MTLHKSKHHTHSYILEQSNIDAIRRATQVLKGSDSAVRKSRELVEQAREIVKHSEKLQRTFHAMKGST